MNEVVQHIVSLDEQYSSVRCRRFKSEAAEYPHRRAHLLRKKLKNQTQTLPRLDYMMKREILLSNQYGHLLAESTSTGSLSLLSASSSLAATAGALIAGALLRKKSPSSSSLSSRSSRSSDDDDNRTVTSSSSGKRSSMDIRRASMDSADEDRQHSLASFGLPSGAPQDESQIAARLAASLRAGGKGSSGASTAGAPISATSLAALSTAANTSASSEASFASHGPRSTSHAERQQQQQQAAYFYAPYHSFSHHFASIATIAFAHYDRDLIAIGSHDGSLSICRALNDPGIVHLLFQNLATEAANTSSNPGNKLPPGQTPATFSSPHAILDLDWSTANEHVLSCSRDGTAKIWDLITGSTVRVIGSPGGTPVTAGRFHPVNNNMIVLGNAKSHIELFNVSTGKAFKGSQTSVSGAVKCLEIHPQGSLLWVGDAQGQLTTFSIDMATGKLTRLSKTAVATQEARPVTSIRFKAVSAGEPASGGSNAELHAMLLVNCRGQDAVYVFGVGSSTKGGLRLLRTFPITNRKLDLRSCWSPLMVQAGAAATSGSHDVVASGSEDNAVYMYDMRQDKPVSTTLQGHSAPVTDVCFNYDESLLVSSDATGIVRVWKKTKKV